ncbi:hypothetical protein M0638_11510 [Roseomonas sp. NAR14]|uniref:Uncharacterized protein n=1 Tax=Roseomonas acroporae TaxID=2937791 RepID=A0A9X2BXJ3_9PROT|nr:hypothetical protein [Roseomonas acroporae]MCK8785010.1 hypothetical protein [Roseomonas acroporae]
MRRRIRAPFAAALLLAAANPVLAAAEEDHVLAALRAEIARVNALPPDRRSVKADATICGSLEQWHQAVRALMEGDLARMAAAPGCARLRRPVRVEVRGFPNPLSAQVRLVDPPDGVAAAGYTMPSAIVDSRAAQGGAERPGP